MAPTNAQMARIVTERLRSKGITYRAASEATGIPLATLHRKTTGRDSFRLDEVAALAALFGIKPSTLVRESEHAA